jgi:hypothetical protein
MLPPAGMSFLLVSRLTLALSADFHVICWESREAQDYYNYCPATFAMIGDHMMPTIYPKALVATAST